jgi:hypothetical protein
MERNETPRRHREDTEKTPIKQREDNGSSNDPLFLSNKNNYICGGNDY